MEKFLFFKFLKIELICGLFGILIFFNFFVSCNCDFNILSFFLLFSGKVFVLRKKLFFIIFFFICVYVLLIILFLVVVRRCVCMFLLFLICLK